MSVQPTTFDTDVTSGPNFRVAAFRLWCPPMDAACTGVLVLVPGSNGDGRGMAEDPIWQSFARRQGLALVGCYFVDQRHEHMNIEAYAKAGEGTGQALLDAISRLSMQAGRPELARLPLLLWGHSAGGQFNYEFACAYPDRVMAFVVNKGGYYFTHVAPDAARRVPGIFFIGQRDDEFRRLSIMGIFAPNRWAGAPWTLAVEPNAGHEEGGTRELAMAYFEAIMRRREVTMPYVGDLRDFRIAPAVQRGEQLDTWLPDEVFARQWQVFVSG